MATWDFGGGCPCGVSKVCDCNNRYRGMTLPEDIRNKLPENIKRTTSISYKTDKRMAKDFDFGFSTHSEEELVAEDKNKLVGLRNMIMPLLNNLMKNPEQPIIKWPGRKEKIEEFIKKMDSYIENKL